jgi:hypothetical protein
MKLDPEFAVTPYEYAPVAAVADSASENAARILNPALVEFYGFDDRQVRLIRMALIESYGYGRFDGMIEMAKVGLKKGGSR